MGEAGDGDLTARFDRAGDIAECAGHVFDEEQAEAAGGDIEGLGSAEGFEAEVFEVGLDEVGIAQASGPGLVAGLLQHAAGQVDAGDMAIDQYFCGRYGYPAGAGTDIKQVLVWLQVEVFEQASGRFGEEG